MDPTANIAAALPRIAAERGDAIAMRCPGRRGWNGLARYDQVLTYRELEARSNAIAVGLLAIGLRRGARTVVMVRPSPEFFLLMFALFKAGIVPVLVDPGIPRDALKHCLDEAAPDAFIGIPLAQLARRVLRWAPTARIAVTVGRRWGGLAGGARARTLAEAEAIGHAASAAGEVVLPGDIGGDEVAAILFTSGSTGVPKGVVYRHRHFAAQVAMLREAFGLAPGGVDLPTFPPFALFDPALGLTSIIPDMDPTRPARAKPNRLLDAIARFKVDQLFGSPALVARLADHGEQLPTIRRVLSAGAPVPADVVARMRALLPEDAQLWTPYGATECLPVAVIEGRELEGTRADTEHGAGTCVGRPVAPNLVRIIAISDAAIADWAEAMELPQGALGEITVSGPTATDSYFRRPQATMLSKIQETLPDGTMRVVHRMGDLGFLDAQGRLWFCGRKSQRVLTALGGLYTEQVEPVFNVHPDVRRTALVGVGARGEQVPVVCVELRKGVGKDQHARVLAELEHLGQGFAHTGRITTFLVHPGFPVDIRHNAKIGREQLAAWATRVLAKRKPGSPDAAP